MHVQGHALQVILWFLVWKFACGREAFVIMSLFVLPLTLCVLQMNNMDHCADCVVR